jgi:hypothetical protein
VNLLTLLLDEREEADTGADLTEYGLNLRLDFFFGLCSRTVKQVSATIHKNQVKSHRVTYGAVFDFSQSILKSQRSIVSKLFVSMMAKTTVVMELLNNHSVHLLETRIQIGEMQC